ncbi:MAG: hypothetical protein NVS2B15_17060 [Pseudarthrobacter sp.]
MSSGGREHNRAVPDSSNYVEPATHTQATSLALSSGMSADFPGTGALWCLRGHFLLAGNTLHVANQGSPEHRMLSQWPVQPLAGTQRLPPKAVPVAVFRAPGTNKS